MYSTGMLLVNRKRETPYHQHVQHAV